MKALNNLSKVEKALNENGYLCQVEHNDYYSEINLEDLNIRALDRQTYVVEVYDLDEDKLDDMKIFKTQKDTIQYLKNIGVLTND